MSARYLTLLLVSIALTFSGRAHGAEAPAFLGANACRVAAVVPYPIDDAIWWNGGCKDGYADGKGVLEWYASEKDKRRLEGILVRGEIVGTGKLHYVDGSYTGTFRRGLPHGSGFFKYTNGAGMYEGGVADGLPEGLGLHIGVDQSTYEGQCKAGKAHGFGKAVFTLGGSYEGEYRDGKFNGKGTIVYAGSGRTWTGQFHDGRPLGAASRPMGELGRFPLKQNDPSTGSRLLADRVVGFAPHDATWNELTPEQQNKVRSFYPALDEGDEPPYPLKGTRAFLKGIADLYARFTYVQGKALVYITVGADGVPTSATTYLAPDPELGRHLSTIGMLQRFKPARCMGKPCEMIYPVMFELSAK